MLELARTNVSVVVCSAAADALDALSSRRKAIVLRVAPDEALLVGPPGEADGIVGDVRALVSQIDADTVVLDATDGWTTWTLGGEHARQGFARLSQLRLPEDGWIQGRVAGVPAKVVVTEDAIRIIVPSMWSDHVGRFVRATCEDLELTESDEPRAWSAEWGVEPVKR